MIFLLMVPLYLLANFYIIKRTNKWLRLFTLHHRWPSILYIVIYIFFSSTFITAAFWPTGNIQRILKLLNNYWYGTFIYILLFLAISDILKIIARRFNFFKRESKYYALSFKITGFVIMLLVIFISIYGALHMNNIKTTSYDISIDKEVAGTDSLCVVTVADFHLGYSVGVPQVKQMVNKINACHPDIILIAGDIFDNSYEALDDPHKLIRLFSSLESKYGVYACYGNHDIEERLLGGFTMNPKAPKLRSTEMEDFLSSAGITTLCDETVLIDNSFYIVGRADYAKTGVSGLAKGASIDSLLKDLDTSKPIIVLEHEPKKLQSLADAGVDVEFAGHTHNGQLAPGNLFLKLLWENPCGLLKKDNFYSIVTSGVGVYGPAMRVGTDSEIVQTTIHFVSLDE